MAIEAGELARDLPVTFGGLVAGVGAAGVVVVLVTLWRGLRK